MSLDISKIKGTDKDVIQTDTKTASEIYTQLGITEPFQTWIAKQPGFDAFESFYGKLPGGALGKDYRLKPTQYALLLPPVPPAPVKVTKKVKFKRHVVIDGQQSVYWYANSIGLFLCQKSLFLLGSEAGAKCKELGIVMGGKTQKEIWPGKKKKKNMWTGWVRTYPIEILESITFPPGTDNCTVIIQDVVNNPDLKGTL